MIKIGILKVKSFSLLLSFVLFSMLFFVWFVFLLFGCVVLGMEWMR